MTKTCLTVFIVLLCTICSATPFLTGAYAQYDLGPGAVANIGTLKTKLLDGGYNAVKMSISGPDVNGLGTILGALGSDVKTILEDNYWNLATGEVGIHNLTYGNFLKMEAEYMYQYSGNLIPQDNIPFTFIVDNHTAPPWDPTGLGDVYNYVFSHENLCGERIGPEPNHSNNYTWVCYDALGHLPGKVLSNPRFRWKVGTHTYPRSIGRDFKFHRPVINENKLYLTVAMKFDSLAVGEEVASIRLKVLNDVNGENNNEFMDYTFDDSNYYEFELHPVNSVIDTTVYNIDYQAGGLEPDDWGNFLFEYYIDFPPEGSIQYEYLIKENPAGDYFLHINPEVFWHGNGRMELDYIVLEDYYHRQARLTGSSGVETDVLSMMKTRVDKILSLPNGGSVSYYYTKDEPLQGQFDMYNKVQSYLEAHYGSVNCPKLITATNLEGSNIIKPDSTSYDHCLNFLSQAQPRTIAVDAYPLYEWSITDILQWNNGTNLLSVQTKVDSIVIKTYKSLAHAIRHNSSAIVRETDIVYIPQIYGEYVPDSSGNVAYWRYLKPPRSMNKCLQLLPLCFSADGIMDFTLLANKLSLYESSYHRLAPLTHGDSYMNIHVLEDDSAFDNLTEAN